MSTLIEEVKNLLGEVWWNDILDILIVAYIFYKLLIFIRDSRAHLVFKGVLVILGVYAVAYLLKLQMVSYIAEVIVRNAALALVVVFQPEIRNVLERVGRMGGGKLSVSSIFSKNDGAEERAETLSTITNVVESTRVLQKQCMGALIVFEREVTLNDIVSTGTVVDAIPNVQVIANIFFNKAPLHDGAVIIRKNRVCAAGCILPLTQNSDIDPSLGTRHRAAIGMSENSDAVVVVVSEESGRISVVCNGEIKSSFDPADASSALIKLLLPEEDDDSREKFFDLRRQGAKLFGRNESEADDDEK